MCYGTAVIGRGVGEECHENLFFGMLIFASEMSPLYEKLDQTEARKEAQTSVHCGLVLFLR